MRKSSLNKPAAASLPRLLTVQQAAELLQVHARTIRRLIDRHELPKHGIGRAVRIAEDDLAGFLARHRR